MKLSYESYGKTYYFKYPKNWFNKDRDKHKQALLSFVPDDYKATAEGFLETANRIDSAINPIVEATIDAVKEDATEALKPLILPYPML